MSVEAWKSGLCILEIIDFAEIGSFSYFLE